MSPPVFVAGLDRLSLALEAPLLKREGHLVIEHASGKALAAALPGSGVRLVILGTRLPEPIPELIARIRGDTASRGVSIVVLVPSSEGAESDDALRMAGANAVLRRPLDMAVLEAWLSKLLVVPRRVQVRVPVQGRVVGLPRVEGSEGFEGLTRNISVNGLLLASPDRLPTGPDVELDVWLDEAPQRIRALGRIVREASEIAWPYLGYGVEFLFVPPSSLEAIQTLVAQGLGPPATGVPSEVPRAPLIHSTIGRTPWIYELLEPVPAPEGWMVEIRRAPRDRWRPGSAGPFYVVAADSRGAALEEARAFVRRHG